LLAHFLQNPAPDHEAEANRLICYLRDTKNMAIEYSAIAGSTFITAVDAVFVENKATGRSTHG
jgi:hypothetical protein